MKVGSYGWGGKTCDMAEDSRWPRHDGQRRQGGELSQYGVTVTDHQLGTILVGARDKTTIAKSTDRVYTEPAS